MDNILFIYLFVLIIEYCLIVNYTKYSVKYNTIKKYTELDSNININTFIINNLDHNKENLLLIPHLELGDNIVLNGAVRYYCEKYDQVILVCKILYYEQIKIMYSDLENLLLFPIPENGDWLTYMKNHLQVNHKILKYYNINFIPMLVIKTAYDHAEYFARSYFPIHWYDELNLSIDIAYTYFKINRNHNMENNLYNNLINIIGKNYVVVIDDEKRNFLIKDIYLSQIKYPIFKISSNSKNKIPELDLVRDPIIFNYIKILENAQEIISIDTSMPWIIDMCNIQVPTSIHLYSRNNGFECQYRNSYISKVRE
jgi:hypothetical protein